MARVRALARIRGAANLVYELVPRFVGDPAGAALTGAVLRAYTPAMSGRSGFVMEGDKGSAQRSFMGSLPSNPQRGLQASVTTGLIDNLYFNGPNALTNQTSSSAGAIEMDARMRALAFQVGR